MFKKYTIIALGALMIAGQANGMGSWARKLWAPSAVAAASVFTAKTTLYKNQFTMNSDPVSLSRLYSDAQLDPEALSKLLESQINFLTLSPSNSFGREKTEELLSYTKCLQKHLMTILKELILMEQDYIIHALEEPILDTRRMN